MEATVSAIYEQGALRLLTPIALPESSKVQVRIQSDPTAPSVETAQTEAAANILTNIYRLLDHIEAEPENKQIRELFPDLLQAELRLLWHHSTQAQRTVAAMLQLSARHIDAESFGQRQIKALKNVLVFFEQTSLSDDDTRACHDELIAAGLPPSIELDSKSVQSYHDDL